MTPTRPPMACSTPRCPGKVYAGGRCDDCKRRARREDVVRRGSPHARGYDAAHRKWRTVILERDPICRAWPRGGLCQAFSTDADHVIPKRLTGDPDQVLELGSRLLDPDALQDLEAAIAEDRLASWLEGSEYNGQGLCPSCHSRKTRQGL